MRDVPESEYRPLISEYLESGYRTDDLLFNRVVLDDERIVRVALCRPTPNSHH